MVTAGPGWSTYLGVAVVHVLHDAAGGEQAAAHVPGGAAAVLRVVVVAVVVAAVGAKDGVHRDVDHGPQPLGVLLAEPKEEHLTDRH